MSSSASNNEKLQVHSCEIDPEEGTDREEGAKIDSKEGHHRDKQNCVLPDPPAEESPPPMDALASNPQPSADETKMAPRLLKKPPTQAIIAGGPLPTVKDQACSIIAPATQGATRQPTQTAHGPNIPGGTKKSKILALATKTRSALHNSRLHQSFLQLKGCLFHPFMKSHPLSLPLL